MMCDQWTVPCIHSFPESVVWFCCSCLLFVSSQNALVGWHTCVASGSAKRWANIVWTIYPHYHYHSPSRTSCFTKTDNHPPLTSPELIQPQTSVNPLSIPKIKHFCEHNLLSFVTLLPSIYYNNLLKCFLTYQRSLRVTCGNYVCILNVCLVTFQITGMCLGPASVALFSLEPQCNRHLVWSNHL